MKTSKKEFLKMLSSFHEENIVSLNEAKRYRLGGIRLKYFLDHCLKQKSYGFKSFDWSVFWVGVCSGLLAVSILIKIVL